MNDFYIGLGIGIGLTLIVDLIYYIRYRNMENKFKKKEKEMMKRLNTWFEQHKK